MALINNISTLLGFGGAKPKQREGALAVNDLHFDSKEKQHVGGHTNLDIQGKNVPKYVDNLPK